MKLIQTPQLPEPAGGTPLALSARDIVVEAGPATLLDGVDLDVRAGEVLAVVGPNGAGKSTLLGVLAGDVIPARGQVRMHGHPLDQIPLRQRARRRGVLLQENNLSFPFTVEDVVRMGRAPWQGQPEEDLDDLAVADAMADTEVTHFGLRRFPTLSGGERSRSSFARVLTQRAGILLLDEPTAALDIRHQERVLAVARRQARAGDAVVIVVHDLSLAAAYADRVALLAGGRLVDLGPPDEVLTAARLEEVYEYPVDVFTHPQAGLVIIPLRTPEDSP